MKFFSVDWGTSSLRVRLVNAKSGSVEASLESAAGSKTLADQHASSGLSREQLFGSVLGEILGKPEFDAQRHHASTVIISGMASSSLGMRELPYATAPLRLEPASFVIDDSLKLPPPFADWRVLLVSGVKTAANVMRGEECELLGLIRQMSIEDDDRRRVVILPGTHSKHVDLAGRTLTSFRTYLTGELFALLQEHSILSSTLKGVDGLLDPDEVNRIAERASTAASSGRGLASLFEIRARHLLQGEAGPAARHALSALLIALEACELSHRTGSGTEVIIAGAAKFSGLYAGIFERCCPNLAIRSLKPDTVCHALALAHTEILGSRG